MIEINFFWPNKYKISNIVATFRDLKCFFFQAKSEGIISSPHFNDGENSALCFRTSSSYWFGGRGGFIFLDGPGHWRPRALLWPRTTWAVWELGKGTPLFQNVSLSWDLSKRRQSTIMYYSSKVQKRSFSLHYLFIHKLIPSLQCNKWHIQV